MKKDKIQQQVLDDVKKAFNIWKQGKKYGDYEMYLYRTNPLPKKSKLLYHFFSFDYRGAHLFSIDANQKHAILELRQNLLIYDTILNVISGKKKPKMMSELFKILNTIDKKKKDKK